jgi:hypothetical protein
MEELKCIGTGSIAAGCSFSTGSIAAGCSVSAGSIAAGCSVSTGSIAAGCSVSTGSIAAGCSVSIAAGCSVSIAAGCSVSTHAYRTLFLFVCVILLHLCVLLYACVRAGSLIGPAVLIMRINKLINNIIISIITVFVPNVADQWLGILFGRSWVHI